MADLSDTELALYAAGTDDSVTSRMARELVALRIECARLDAAAAEIDQRMETLLARVSEIESRQAADKDRVRSVVRDAAFDQIERGYICLSSSDARQMADAIASCVAEQLATPSDDGLDDTRRNAIAALRNGTTLAEVVAVLIAADGEQLPAPAVQLGGPEALAIKHWLDSELPYGNPLTAKDRRHNAMHAALTRLLAHRSMERSAVQLSEDERNELSQLRRIVSEIPARTKHGPGGSGDVGPCSDGCLKCRAEAYLAARRGAP